MKLAILGASGGTGRELVSQALARGHDVTALARDPARLPFADHPRLKRVRIDLNDPATVHAALDPQTVVLSGLGIARGEKPGALLAGARAVVTAKVTRVIWLGAFGTGASARAGGWLVRMLLALLLGKQLTDKIAADTLVLQAGGTVFHAGPLSEGALSQGRHTVAVSATPSRLFPAGISRASVAAAMLDEAESPHFPGAVAIPLEL